MCSRRGQIDLDNWISGAIESGLFASALGANLGAATMRADTLEQPDWKPPARAPLVRAPPPSQEYSQFHSLGPRLPALPSQPQQMRACAPAAALAQMPATTEEHAAGAYGASHAAAQLPRYGHQQMRVGTPDARQRKLTVRKFDGTELHSGLGSGFYDWGRTFLRQVNMVQAAYGLLWKEDIKSEYFLNLVAVGNARCGADTLAIDNIVNHAPAELANVLKAKYDLNRIDHLRHAEELENFARPSNTTATSNGQEVLVVQIDAPVQRKETRKCHGCGKGWHIQAFSRSGASNVSSNTRVGEAARPKNEDREEIAVLQYHDFWEAGAEGLQALVQQWRSLFFVVAATERRAYGTADVIMAVLTADDVAIGQARDVQVGSLIHFHQRLKHISYDTIERTALNLDSGIKLSDRRRLTCGSLMPKVCLGKRSMVNFVDHRSNYCRVILSKSKDQAAKKFEHFLALFKRRFGFKNLGLAYPWKSWVYQRRSFLPDDWCRTPDQRSVQSGKQWKD
ncbi:unnamed protein product [Peronospora belbahrii]|uniref:Uncharacterized protein n=1 Tax=Peronospora belbahrii TaxID=622444 RepID=A0ABN8DDI8_9STRA|nr:unnamed protein product [Peronospora belbahrii]